MHTHTLAHQNIKTPNILEIVEILFLKYKFLLFVPMLNELFSELFRKLVAARFGAWQFTIRCWLFQSKLMHIFAIKVFRVISKFKFYYKIAVFERAHAKSKKKNGTHSFYFSFAIALILPFSTFLPFVECVAQPFKLIGTCWNQFLEFRCRGTSLAKCSTFAFIAFPPWYYYLSPFHISRKIRERESKSIIHF